MTHLPTPESVALMTEKAIAATTQAVEEIRAIGRQCRAWGESMDDECQRLADDFEGHAKSAADAVLSYARRICDQALEVRKLRDSVGGIAINGHAPAQARQIGREASLVSHQLEQG